MKSLKKKRNGLKNINRGVDNQQKYLLIWLDGIKYDPHDLISFRKIYETTQEEIDCSCDNKDDDHAHHISETTKLRETISNVINTSSDELTMDLSTLSLENLSLANAYSKHAIMYRTLREKYDRVPLSLDYSDFFLVDYWHNLNLHLMSMKKKMIIMKMDKVTCYWVQLLLLLVSIIFIN